MELLDASAPRFFFKVLDVQTLLVALLFTKPIFLLTDIHDFSSKKSESWYLNKKAYISHWALLVVAILAD